MSHIQATLARTAIQHCNQQIAHSNAARKCPKKLTRAHLQLARANRESCVFCIFSILAPECR